MARHDATLDWVEDATGERYAYEPARLMEQCERVGHDDYVSSVPVQVNGHLAAYRTCSRCGRTGFHFVKEGAGAVMGARWPGNGRGRPS